MKRIITLSVLFMSVIANTQQTLSLREALSTAMRSNPSLVAAEREIAAARAELSMAKARKGPMVSLNGFATTGNQTSILSSAPRVDPAAFMMSAPNEFAAVSLMLMLPLYTGGILEASVAAARGEELVAIAEAEEMKGEVLLEVQDAFLMALLAQEMADAEAARVTANEEMVRTTRAQFEAGTGIEASVKRSEAELAMARREHLSAQNERRKALLELKEAMGVDLSHEIIIAGDLDVTPVSKSLESFLSDARTNRGALHAARAQLESARAELRAAEGALKPQVYGVAMGDVNNQPGMRSGYTLGVTASFPVFDSGERRSEVRRMRAMRDRAEALLKQTELRVEKEARQAWLDLQTAEQNVASAEAAVDAAQAAYEVVSLRVASGKGILVEQLDALEALTRARAELAQARYDFSIALARLRRAAGLNPEGGTL